MQLMRKYRKEKKLVPEKEVWRLAYEISLGIEYLHKSNIAHWDLKNLNILLTKDLSVKVCTFYVKIGDLGVSKVISSEGDFDGSKVGTPLYLAPELIREEPYTFKIDIWSLGCCLYHLTSQNLPFKGENIQQLGSNI